MKKLLKKSMLMLSGLSLLNFTTSNIVKGEEVMKINEIDVSKLNVNKVSNKQAWSKMFDENIYLNEKETVEEVIEKINENIKNVDNITSLLVIAGKNDYTRKNQIFPLKEISLKYNDSNEIIDIEFLSPEMDTLNINEKELDYLLVNYKNDKIDTVHFIFKNYTNYTIFF